VHKWGPLAGATGLPHFRADFSASRGRKHPAVRSPEVPVADRARKHRLDAGLARVKVKWAGDSSRATSPRRSSITASRHGAAGAAGEPSFDDLAPKKSH
jgi:hypothetical protein